MKYIKATLKEQIWAAVEADFDFVVDPLVASAQTERSKRNLTLEIRQKLHEKIATLHLDDIIFTFTNKL